LLFLGPPGTGKTHLAVALGREAIRQNYSVQFVNRRHRHPGPSAAPFHGRDHPRDSYRLREKRRSGLLQKARTPLETTETTTQ
jgi:DNA polymerase III delta prime subunit